MLAPLAGCAATSTGIPQDAASETAETQSPEADLTEGEVSPETYRWWRDLVLSTGVPGIPGPESVGPDGVNSWPAAQDPDLTDGDILVAPIPFIDPTIGAGLVLGAAYLTKLDPISPASTLGGGVMFSDNGSFAAGIGFNGYFSEDRYRATIVAAKARIRYDLALDDGRNVPLQQDVLGLNVQFLARVAERVFIGPQVLVSGLDTSFRKTEEPDTIPEDELEATNIALGVIAQRDTRDSPFYPRAGSLADLQFRLFHPDLGSTAEYQVLPLSYNHYLSLGQRDVLALRASLRTTFGDVPFYGQSYFGSSADLRGYVIGTVYDDSLGAVQAEYRRELFWRLGAVAFAGVGAVASDVSDLFEADALPSGGFGLRFLLEKKNHINLRVDFAWGDGQEAIYFGVGEAF